MPFVEQPGQVNCQERGHFYDGEDTAVYIEDLESGSQQWELAIGTKRNQAASYSYQARPASS